MSRKIFIHVETLSPEVQIPQYANLGDAGMDVRSNINKTIKPQETVIIPTGLKVAIPEGYEIQVRPRSGMSFKTPIRVSNSPGTIDCGYRNEIGAIITNTSLTEDFTITKGDRIAQLVANEVPEIIFIKTEDVSKIGEDRNGGFGSTGTK
jgi:dUTP pyrophosphatase